MTATAPPPLAGRPERRAEAAEAGRDAPPGPRAAGHRQDPTLEPRGVPAHPGRGRDQPPATSPTPAPGCGKPRSRSPRPSTSSTSPPPRSRTPTFDYLASLEWIRAAENICLIGPAGTGKSHLLVALGLAAVARRAQGPLLHRRRARRDPLPRPGRQHRRPRHRHPAAQRPDHLSTNSASPRWTTPAPNCCSGSSPPPTNAAPSASARTGRSSPGAGSSPNTPPPSACSTGSCTTATSWSPTATPTG